MKIGREKMNKNTEKIFFYKTNPSGGISLIVLVITIIVVIILAAAVIVSLQNNNPMFQASEARIKSDIANMQAIFTNAVGKVMAENQDTLTITAGKLNSVTSGAKNAVGNAVYTLADGTKGEIIFDELEKDGLKYYTGSKLPLYKQKTAWYVDEQGLIAVEVGNKKYGEGRIVKSIKISTQVTPVEEYIITKVKVKIDIEYEDEVESIKFGGEDVTVPQKQDGKYVVEKEVTENGTYEIEVNGQNEVKNTATVEVNQIDEMSKQISIGTSVDLSEKYSAKVKIEVSSVEEIGSITFGGVSVSGIRVIDGKYVGEVTVAQNGTYEIEAKGKSGSKNKTSLTITQIQKDERIEIAQSANPMLQSWVYEPTTDFHTRGYRQKIKKVKFAITDKVPDNKIESWDVSDAKDKSVMAWVEDDGNSGYILTIAGKNKIIANQNSRYLFCSFYALNTIENIDLLDTSQVTNMSGMFMYCENLTSLNLSNFNTEKVTDMAGIFSGCKKLTNLDISNFNTSNVTNMANMFGNAYYLTNLDLSHFDTSKVTSMSGMFYNCISLTNLNIANFDTSNVTNMKEMFKYSTKVITTLNIKGVNKVYTDMFAESATDASARITVNYTSSTSSLVDSMIATKSSNSNVVKGVQVN